jgi:osmotically-inducible protein OsmY
MKRTQGVMAVVAGLGLVLAGQLASADEGTRDGTRGKPDPLADAKLELDVETELMREHLAEQVVIVEANNGVVTLTGTVGTSADKVHAEQVARSAGAARIDNRITVADQAGNNAAKNPDREQRPAARLESPQNERAAQPDPRRRVPLVGTTSDQTGPKEIPK